MALRVLSYLLRRRDEQRARFAKMMVLGDHMKRLSAPRPAAQTRRARYVECSYRIWRAGYRREVERQYDALVKEAL